MKHKHHIIPRHAGGTDHPDNLVELTIEEHSEAHRKLWEEHGRWQDRVAWLTLSGQIGIEEARVLAIKCSLSSPETKIKLKNRKHIHDGTKKIGNKARTGLTVTIEHRNKISQANKGMKRTDQTRNNMRLAWIKRKAKV